MKGDKNMFFDIETLGGEGDRLKIRMSFGRITFSLMK